MVFNVESDIPQISEKDWQISISGQVENPFSIRLKDLKSKFPASDIEANILCLRGVTIGGTWSGVSVSQLLEQAEIMDSAFSAQIKAYSNYFEPIGLDDLMKPDVVFAYNLDNEPIPPEQGGLLRLIVPGKYAYKSVKWVNELHISQKKHKGFWEKKGYPFRDSSR